LELREEKEKLKVFFYESKRIRKPCQKGEAILENL
jgi:hypothetical protein